jgi:tetratricopeptide (TPR) repeat protein
MRSIATSISILGGLFILLGFSLFFISCPSCELIITPDMPPAMYFYKAQDAAQKNCYEVALGYYQKFLETYPDNLEKVVWAEYEIAVLYHKMGNDEKALELINALLLRYQNNTSQKLPEAPKSLALKVKTNLEKIIKPPPPAK